MAISQSREGTDRNNWECGKGASGYFFTKIPIMKPYHQAKVRFPMAQGADVHCRRLFADFGDGEDPMFRVLSIPKSSIPFEKEECF